MFQIVKLLFLLGVLVGGGGTALTIANPEGALAGPFKAPAALVLQGGAAAVKAAKDTRTVAASYERKIVSTAVRSMMIEEGVNQLTPITTPTNDMTVFPSKVHPLYPAYLESKATEFKYTCDANGVVKVDPKDATTDPLLEEILGKLQQLKAE